MIFMLVGHDLCLLGRFLMYIDILYTNLKLDVTLLFHENSI